MASVLPVHLKKDEESSIPDHFFCPICLELPTEKVFQCKKGHPLCSTCHSKCEECPNCRVPFDKVEPIRNLYFENLLDTVVTVDCAYSGCEYHPTRNLVQEHQSKCHFNIEKFGKLIKVCKLIGYQGCEFSVNNGNILDAVDHFGIVHCCIITEGEDVQMELTGFKEAVDSNENYFWSPVISDIYEKKYFILTIATMDRNLESLTCFSLIMPELKEFEETIKIEYSVSSKNNDSLTWGIFQNAVHFSKLERDSNYATPCCFDLQKLKFHTLENGSLVVNIRVHEVSKNSSKVEKKENRVVCEKRPVCSLPCCLVPECAQSEPTKVTKDPTEIKVEKLPDSVTKDSIKIIFSKFGEIRSIDMFKFGANTCLIVFVDKDSVQNVIEKKKRVFVKKNGKKHRLEVDIYQKSEPVANKEICDEPVDMSQSNNVLLKKEFKEEDRDLLSRGIKHAFVDSRAYTDDLQYNATKSGLMLTAAMKGNLDSVKYFIGKGIDVNLIAKTPSEAIPGTSVLGYTMLDENKKIGLEKAKLLIEKGANINYKDPLGRSYLHLSVLSGSDAATEFFLGKGLNVNEVTKAGETPLHVALLSKTGVQFFIQKVKLLLDHGADLNIKDNKGQSCLDLVKKAPFEYWGQIEAIFKRYQKQSHSVLEVRKLVG